MRIAFASFAAALIITLATPLHAEPVLTQFHGGPDHTGVFTGPSPGNLVKTVWTADLGNYTIASPVVADGLLYIGTKSGTLTARDKTTGALVWQFKADASITATVAVANGAVFFQSDANTVYAVDAKDGHELWHRATGATVPFSSMAGFSEGTNWDYWASSPLYADGVVTIGSGDSNVYALDAKDGRILWSFKTGSRVRATPTTDGKLIYIGGFDGVMYALDPKTGKQRWSFKTEGNSYFPVGSIQSAATVADGLVVFGSRDYNVYALDAKTGKEVWKNLHAESWAAPATPAVKDGRVYVPSSDAHFIRCNDLKTGAVIWTAPTDSNVYSAPAIVGDGLYAGTFGGAMARMKLADGKTGAIIVQERIYSSPWIDAGVLYFATADGMLYAVTNGEMPKRPS